MSFVASGCCVVLTSSIRYPSVGLQRLALRVRQPAQLGLVDGDPAGVAGLAVEALERAGELGQPAVELPQAGLVGVVERDARAAEGAQGLVERVLVLLVEGDLAHVGAAAQLLEPGEQAAVEVDRVGVLGASRGAISSSIASISGVASEACTAQNAFIARRRSAPASSQAPSTVLDGRGSRVVAQGGQLPVSSAGMPDSSAAR